MEDVQAKLAKLTELRDQNIIKEAEFEVQRQKMLDTYLGLTATEVTKAGEVPQGEGRKRWLRKTYLLPHPPNATWVKTL